MTNKTINKLTLAGLKAADYNPRNITEQEVKALSTSLDEFGDISGVSFNELTGNLVGGHQRTKLFREMGAEERIEIVKEFKKPTKRGTMAHGFVILDGERYSFRIVRWELAKEMAANLAANSDTLTGSFTVDIKGILDQVRENSADLFDGLNFDHLSLGELSEATYEVEFVDDDDEMLSESEHIRKPDTLTSGVGIIFRVGNFTFYEKEGTELYDKLVDLQNEMLDYEDEVDARNKTSNIVSGMLNECRV